MIDKILANKPDSIFDIIPEQVFAPDFNTDYLRTGNCFEWYYAIAKAIQPKSFLEIGVRYGYSFLPTLLGSESLQIATGWDLETYGNNNVAIKNLSENYHGSCVWNIEHVDSQITPIPRYYDLISIDGDHSFDGKMKDLRNTIGKCEYVILDDYNYMPDVGPAVNAFIQETGSDGWGRPSIIDWVLYLPSFRGSILFKYKK